MTLDRSTFLSVVELADGTLMMGAQNGNFDIAERPHSIIKTLPPGGEWSDRGQMAWTAACVSSSASGNGIVHLGAYGRWVEVRLDGHEKGDVIPDVDEEDPPTVFRFIKLVAGQLYAGGLDRFLFRRTSQGWEEVSTREMTKYPEAGSAEGLTGFSPDELYAVGWDGEIWTNQSGGWKRTASPVSLILNDADVCNDRVYVGGQTGVILEGRAGDWDVIENGVIPDDIWCVRAFKGAVYFSTTSGILRFAQGELSLAKAVGPDMRTATSLFVGPSGLWSVGDSDLVLFDGDEWRTIAQS